MDSDKSIYFQNTTTNPLRQLRRKLSKTKENETNFKKSKLENTSTIQQNLPTSLEVGSDRLKDDFFNVSCEQLARNLLGKILVRNLGDVILKGRIVETECYPGGEDKASHSFNGKITARNKPMFMKPGTCYVYLTYGMYHCFNISCQGEGAAVLIRALEPIKGIDRMLENRLNFQTRKTSEPKKKQRQIHSRDLCNGPGKLCVALQVDTAEVNEKDICSWNGVYIEEDVQGREVNGPRVYIKEDIQGREVNDPRVYIKEDIQGREVNDPRVYIKEDIQGQEVNDPIIVASTRIGIDSYGEPWTKKLWRFYIYGNRCVSKFDRTREKEIIDQT
ncbi:putative 3-methyladenine DNA glycosylase isoform X2 [Nilaparvata lugens]|uniref:putative 3-methyladenine DNA glycosylase isoform X2 n=1 Tax=Nilaparvata lugens TaxID=108931 RepID=UPI00193E2074|nr:putative 3-methyladenine DNA glycosylase isoform X2 [Nilaparvata lugens]